jgi:Ca2+-binding EF-hand superfamily protein
MCGNRMMQRMDANNDGKVSKEEFVTAHEKMFAQMDTNQDGVLNQDELGKKCEHMREGMGKHKGMGPGMNMEPPAMNQPAQ